ncbi:hypothetical protein EU527_04915 [Candidatus Thorarchaeota archaeon]|nr:MAG: hypothetical protein EU527_04915 [Candidatus Thorarchaeota archaeon]
MKETGGQIMSSNFQELKYSFSLGARQVSQRYARDLGALVTLLDMPENHYIVDAAEKRIYSALTHNEIDFPIMRDEKEVLIYPTARLIVEVIGNPRLRALQAEAESKAVNKYLANEDAQFVLDLCTSAFDWTVESMGDVRQRAKLPINLRPFDFKMRFEDFLEVAPDFHADEWKLINRFVDQGWVYVRRKELNRLISGKARRIILEGKLDIPKLPRRLTESVQRIEAEVKTKIRQAEPFKLTGQVTSAFPPCIQKMYDDSVSGQVNLPHDARFALAAFLLRIGMSEDEVNKVFGHSPDKDNRLIEYQVDHIASKRSSRADTDSTGYTPTGCKKLQTNNLCPVYLGLTFDPLCEYVLNPLAFYTTRAWEISKGVTNHSWYAQKKDKKQSF